MSWSRHQLWLLLESVNEFQALYVKAYTPPVLDRRQAAFSKAVKPAFESLESLRGPLTALMQSMEFEEANQPFEGL